MSMEHKATIWFGICETIFILFFLYLLFLSPLANFSIGIILSLFFIIRDIVDNYIIQAKKYGKSFKFDWENSLKSFCGYLLFSGAMISLGYLSEFSLNSSSDSYYLSMNIGIVVFSIILFVCLCLDILITLFIGEHYLLKMYK